MVARRCLARRGCLRWPGADFSWVWLVRMLAMLCTAECATNGRLRRVVCGSALLHSPPGFGNCQGSPFRRADLTRRVWIEPLSQSRNGVAAAGCSPVCSLLCVRENGWGGGARTRAVCGETAFIGRAQGRRCPDSMSANSVLHVLHRAVAIFCAFLDDQGMG